MVIMVPDPKNPGEYKPIKKDLTTNPLGPSGGSSPNLPKPNFPIYKPKPPLLPPRIPIDGHVLTLPKEYWAVQPGTGVRPGATGGSGGAMILVKNPDYRSPIVGLPLQPITFKPLDKPPLWASNSMGGTPTILGKYGEKKSKSKKKLNKLTKFHGI